MNELALFAGTGGGILGSRLLGWRTICAVELCEYRRGVLERRQIDGVLHAFPLWDDIRTFDGLPWRGRVDVVSGGFPCQAHSSAARGRNVAEDLWPEMFRVITEVAPSFVFAENVTRDAIDQAADELESLGYKTRCISLSAADLGADHVRPRFWLRAYADEEGELRSTVDAEVAWLQRICSRVWEAEPDESRVADGMADRVDRLKAAGDGQVAIMAAAAWRLLSAGRPSVTENESL